MRPVHPGWCDVIETSTGDTWGNLCYELDSLHLPTLTTPCRPAPPALRADPVRNHPQTLQLSEPPRFFEFTSSADSLAPNRRE